MTSVSDNAIIIGIIAVGVFWGTTMTYDKMNLDVSNGSFIIDILTWIGLSDYCYLYLAQYTK
jgi:hypothetical protein